MTRNQTLKPTHWLVLGGIALGSLDILFAFTFWQSQGLTLARLFQSIARGVLGTASYQGGATTAWLGAGLHYLIAIAMVAIYYLVSRRFTSLVRRPVLYGLPYGILLYVVMNFVVLPLSAAGMPKFDNMSWVVSSIAMHAIFGVICALFSRKAQSVT